MTSTGDEIPLHVLRDYALLADGERGALVGPHGDVAWLCVPRWHDEAVFAGLLGSGGRYTVTPVGRYVWGGHYREGTLVWHGRWLTDAGEIGCRQALAMPARPGTPVLLRRITALSGDARVRVTLDPRAGYGTRRSLHPHREGGVWSARSGALRWRFAGAPRARVGRHGELVATLVVPAGEHRDLVFVIGAEGADLTMPDAEACWRDTERAWSGPAPALDTFAARDCRQATAVLRGLTSAGGGMVAAATTSLPERWRTTRQYDYRYVWIRDQALAGQAAAAAGWHRMLDDTVRFIGARLLADGPDLRPAYTVDGGPVPPQRELTVPGYPGGHNVVGNRARRQFQLDVFGEALLALAAAGRADRLDTDALRAVGVAARAVEARWTEPDAGIWELEPRRWTHSRLICAAGLRAVAGLRPAPDGAAGWQELADTIVADTGRHARHPSGRWQRAHDDPGPDGALLLAGIRGAVPPEDPRTDETLRACVRDLTDDGYAYRFRHDGHRLGEAEGSFTLCGFLLSLASARQGDDLAASRWFERARSAAGQTGLFTEEYDVASRQPRGNLPQAFVHAALLESAVRLTTRWRGDPIQP